MLALIAVGLYLRAEGGAPREPIADELLAVHGQSVAPTDRGLFVYGGYGPLGGFDFENEAALLDPVTGRVDRLPDPPFGGALQPPTAIGVSGDSVVVLGSLCRRPEPDLEACPPARFAAAEIDLSTRRWTPLQLPPYIDGPARRHEALGTTPSGQMVFAIGHGDDLRVHSYRSERGEWEALAAAPRRLDDVCLAGDLVVGATAEFRIGDELLADDPITDAADDGRPVVTGAGDGFTNARLVQFDLGAESGWHESTPYRQLLIPAATDRVTVDCMGDAAMIADLSLEGGGVHQLGVAPAQLRSAWTEVPPPPALGAYTQRLWDGSSLLVLNQIPPEDLAGGPMLRYVPDRNEWMEVLGGPTASRSLAVLDGRIVGFSTSTTGPVGGSGDPSFVSYDVVDQ